MRTKEFARATSLRFLSNGGTPLLSRTLRDYVHFLPLPPEYVRTAGGTGFDASQREPAFYSGRTRRATKRTIARRIVPNRSHGSQILPTFSSLGIFYDAHDTPEMTEQTQTRHGNLS